MKGALRMKRYTEWIDQAEEMYQRGMKFYQIANELGVDRKVVSYRLKQLGYKADARYVRQIPPEKLRKYDYSYAETLFEVIDTEEKAYWLGVLYADGDVSDRVSTVSLALKESDLEHVKRFRAFFHLEDKKITEKYKRQNGKTFKSYEFAVNSQVIKEQLIRLGCVPQKTFRTSFPSDEIVPAELKHHFMRGYFDGDGHIGTATTAVLSVEILGTENFLNGYQKWLGIRKNKLHSFATTEIKHSMYGGFAAIYIMDKLYDGATVYLESKHSDYLALRRLRMKSVKRPKSIIAEYSGKGSSKPDPRLKALLEEASKMQ